jgi:beta-lactamase superfamily II metal-dependent hydrolase
MQLSTLERGFHLFLRSVTLLKENIADIESYPFTGCTSTETNQATQASAVVVTQHKTFRTINKVPVTPQVEAIPSTHDVSGELQVHFIDVGQGASQLLIGSSGITILIDAGNNNQEEDGYGRLHLKGAPLFG